jgi:hypothetical protein
MIDSDFNTPIIEERPPQQFPVGKRVEPAPVPIYHHVQEGKINGSRILHMVEYNHPLCAAIFAPRDDYIQLLASIVNPQLIKNVGTVVVAIRQGLGLPIDLDIAALTGEGKVLNLNSGG